MQTLLIAFVVGVYCFLSACNLQTGRNPVEKGKKAIALKRDGAKIYYRAELDKAPIEFQKAVQVDPRAQEYKNLGTSYSYLEQGELDKALVEFRKAIQVDPRFVEAHYLLADVYALKGERLLSLKSLERAMTLDGSYIIDVMTPIPIESTKSTKPPFPPEFFQGPIEYRRLDPIDRPQKR